MTGPTERQRIDDYMMRVALELGTLPPSHRQELLETLRDHVEARCAQLTDHSDAAVLTLLDRVGDPLEFSQAAREDREPASPASAVSMGLSRGIVHWWLFVAALVLTGPFIFAIFLGPAILYAGSESWALLLVLMPLALMLTAVWIFRRRRDRKREDSM